jgi:hypothetical protein
VPVDVTVNVLVKAMIASPSKNYIIDGFPHSVEEAQHFE